jgi:outer membrane protein assembly factor BamB
MHDGILYAGSEDGHLYLIDAATGSEVCSLGARATIVANPVVSDDIVYVGTMGSVVWILPAGGCAGKFS